LNKQWNEFIFVSIYKRGDKTGCSNYRALSLLLNTHKILSNIRLPRFLHTQKKILTKRYTSHSVCLLTIKKNAESLIVASKEIGLAVNCKTSKCRFLSPKQHSGQNHNINIGSKSFEREGHLIHWETTLTNQNYIHKKKRRLKSGTPYYSV